jgi:hypothetical protein
MKKRNIFVILQYVLIFIFIVSCVNKEQNDIGIKDETTSIIIENDIENDIEELYSELNSVLDDDYKKSFGNNICIIHYEQMHKEKIIIHYGLIALDDVEMEYNELKSLKMIEFNKLKKTHFPNSSYSLWGGCVISDENNFYDYICNECNNERDKYKNILGL